MTPADPQTKGELALIARLRRELAPAAESGAPAAGDVPFGDDMAAVPGIPGLLWTVDMLMDGVDFESGRHAWYDVGRKAMGASLSDCAAMAARPLAALCAVALSDAMTMEDALDLHRGARDCGVDFGCPIVGGDTNSWNEPTVVSITVVARTEEGRAPVLRSGAQPGDHVYLTGPVGGSRSGRHLHPQPRIETALALNRELTPHAMIDISDGLALDLWRVLESSRCGAVIDERQLAALVHADAVELAKSSGRPASEHGLYDGEDFELIVVLPREADVHRCRSLGLLPLGEIVMDQGLWMQRPDGGRVPVERRGWEHFR